MKILTDTLYTISNALLTPVIIALLLMLAWTLALLGGFIKELVERRNVRRRLNACLSAAKEADADVIRIWCMLNDIASGLPQRFTSFVENQFSDERIVTQAISQLESEVADSVAKHSFITRISPILGLMGTLIPLGPALSGLANGDMQVLGGNLVVAFTATVVGLLISALAYGTGLARRAWYSRDLSDLEFISSQLLVRERNYAS
jgi:biopolymer transport protein ExbB/TolQ